MRAGARQHPGRWATALAVCVTLVIGCGNTATPSGAPQASGVSGSGAPASAGAGATPAASAGLLPSTTTYAEASARESADVQAMRDEVGFSTLIGADAQAVRDFVAGAEKEFSAKVFAEAAAKFGLEPTARGGSRIEFANFVEDLTAPDLQSQSTGYVALGGLLIAKSDEPLAGAIDNTTTKRGTAGGSDVEQVNKVHLEVALGQGLTELLVNLESSTKTSKEGVVSALVNGTGKSKVKINSCPDESGLVKGEVEIAVGELSSSGGATSTSDLSVKATFTLTANSSAGLSAIQIDTTTSGGGIGGGSSWTAGGHTFFGGGGEATSTSSGASPEQLKRVTDGAFYAIWAVSAIASEAERFWRSGKCVDMNTSFASKSVSPKEKVTFTVEPRGAFDKKSIKAGVDVTFSGKESVEKQGGNQQPPVSLTYTAGEKKDDKGTVSVKQTSVRGIGSTSITFTVGEADYRVDYAGGYIYSGTKCKGLPGAWTLQINVGGGTGTVTFTIPENLGPAEATTNYELSIAGTRNTFKLKGKVTPSTDAEGKAFLLLALGSGTLTQQHPDGAITIPYTDPTTDNIPLESGSFCD